MTWKRIAEKFRAKLLAGGRLTYSQCGEDMIAGFALSLFGIRRPTYLDIGANHPTNLSNTRLFYDQGGKGVCVEPNPGLCKYIKQVRPRDVCLNVGISPDKNSHTLRFFSFDDPTLSTFSESVMREVEKRGTNKVIGATDIPCLPVNEVIGAHFGKAPNFISLDTEGLDMPILESFDFGRFRPELFCIETREFSTHRRMNEVITLMADSGYEVFADTFINTLFVDHHRMGTWMQKWRSQSINPNVGDS